MNPSTRCFCGAENPDYAEATTSEGCGGHGWLECLNHGQVACPGCAECEKSDCGGDTCVCHGESEET